MRRPFLRLLAPLAALLLGLAGLSCGKLTGTLRPHTLPETTIFVSGPVDTVNHIVHVYWFGSDPNGFITGFELRLLNPAAPADTAWTWTTRTDSVLTVFTPAGYTAPVLEVRAVDDDGARDPSPARQEFQFRNQPPVVRITQRPGPRDSTFASVTVGWSVSDPDGDATKVRYLVWLDGNEATPEQTVQTTFTMPSERFKVNGQYTGGLRKLYVRGIDDGGMAGPVDSMAWQVKKPVAGSRARLLIVDDVPRTHASNPVIDTLYSNTAARNLPSDSYTVLRLDFNQPFASAKDIEQTFKQFEAVIWYRANVTTSVATTLRSYQEGVGAYLEAGGRFYLDGLYLFSGLNASGALDEDFARTYLDCDGFRKCFQQVSGSFTDSTLGWGNVNGSVYRSAMFSDSLRLNLQGVIQNEAGGFRVFKPRSNAIVALRAQPGALTPVSPESLVVGVSVPQPSGGRAVVLAVPVGNATPSGSSTAPRFLAKVFSQLGLTGP